MHIEKHSEHAQLDQGLLKIIGCPECKGTLTQEGQNLRCRYCRIDYPIEEGIPALLTPQLRTSLEKGEAAVKNFYMTERYDWIRDPRGLEYIYHHYRRWKTWREITKLLKKGNIVLDVGCGTGLITQRFSQQKYKVVALDLNQWALSRIDSKPYVTMVQGDAESLPIQDNSVDLVVATEIIEHLEDSEETARELFRVCIKGGLVVGSAPTTSYIWKMRRYFSLTCAGNEPFHRNFPKRGITAIWQKAGFKVNIKRSCLGLNWMWILKKP